MEGLQFDNEELRHETEFLRNKVAMFYNEARMREDEGGHGGGEGFSREEMPPPSSVRCVCLTCVRFFRTEHPFRDGCTVPRTVPRTIYRFSREETPPPSSLNCVFCSYACISEGI